MANKPILLDETFDAHLTKINDNMAVMNEHMRKLVLATGGDYKKPAVDSPTVWEEIQVLCRNGKITSVLEVGDIYNVVKDGISYPFAVMDFITEEGKKGSLQIKNRNLTTGVIFQSLDILYNLQFDEREAFYAAIDSGLSAGTYNFTLGAHSWYSADVGKTFQFTLTQDIPKGGQLVWTQAYSATLEGSGINVFASSDSTAKVETATMTEGSSGTSLGTINNAINDNFNSCQRGLFGSNRWMTSAVRQQLNSDAIAGSVWIPQTPWDRPPSWVASTKGFLNGLDAGLQECIVEMEINTYKNTVCDGGGIDTTTDKIFLAGRNECHFLKEGDDDGIAWDFYRIGSQYTEPSNNADPIRIKKTQSGSPYYWWLRSPYVGGASNVRNVITSGVSDGYSASDSYGVAPAFVIA